MSLRDKTPMHIKLEERHLVEKPLFDQLAGLGLEVIDYDSKAITKIAIDSFRS